MTGKPVPFVWYELVTSDAPAARKFYCDVIGWKAQDSGVPGVDYTLLGMTHDCGVAGLMALPEDAKLAGMPPSWIGYLGVDDTDATVAAIVKAGGLVQKEPADIPGVGRFAVVADPQGTTFALIQSDMGGKEPPPKPPMGAPGTVGWHELMAADGEAAFAFYSGLFGWTKDEALKMDGDMGVYQLFRTDGEHASGGMMTKPPMIPVPYWGFYFNVPALDAAIERVNAGGGQIINGPMEVPGGQWIINGIDPQGAPFSLVAPHR